MEMKVVNVDFVENEMVELDVVQIGLNHQNSSAVAWLPYQDCIHRNKAL